METDLNKYKLENSKFRFRVEGRQIPYYSIIKEFFPDTISKVINEPHEC